MSVAASQLSPNSPLPRYSEAVPETPFYLALVLFTVRLLPHNPLPLPECSSFFTVLIARMTLILSSGFWKATRAALSIPCSVMELYDVDGGWLSRGIGQTRLRACKEHLQ